MNATRSTTVKTCLLAVALLHVFAITAACAQGKTFNVKDFGARGDGKTLDTSAIQKAIDACHDFSGGTVLFPPGKFRSGTIMLKSNVRLHLEANATLLGSQDLRDYVKRPGGEFCYGTDSSWVFIHATNVENVVIDGNGTIDGARAGFTDPVTGQWKRGPLGILFERSRNISLNDLTVTQIPGWAVTFFDSDDIVLRNVRVLNVMADGINPVCCRHVLYDGVNIDGTGDDPITIKNEGSVRGTPLTSDILITNCTVRNTKHPGVKIGTGTAGVFRNIQVRNCVFDLSGTVFAIQLMRPSHEAERVIENVELSDIIVHRAKQLFDITTIGVERPVIRNLKISNVSYQSDERGVVTSTIWGTERAPIQNLTISNLTVADNVKTTWLSMEHVQNARLSGLELDFPHAKTALSAASCKNLQCDKWTFAGLAGAGPVIKLTNVDGFSLSNSTSPPVKNFLLVSGASSRNVGLRGMETGAAAIPILADISVPASGLSETAKGVILKEFHAPQRVKPNEEISLSVSVAGATRAGPYRLAIFEGGHELGAQWIWASADKGPRPVSFTIPPFYTPGRHELALTDLSAIIECAQAPAEFVYGEYAEIISPAANGALTRVKASVKNIGGSAGTHIAELRADGRPVATKKLYLLPGEEREITLDHSFARISPRVLTLGDLPPWPFFTAANVDARFFWGHKRLVIEAGGENGHYDQYAAIYFRDVPGDFDAIAQLHSQSMTTGNNSAIGLMIRNRIDDYSSLGFTSNLRVPIYGGYKVWFLDLDNDGILETQSPGGDSGLPCWYKFEKRGRQFRAYTSTDRKQWKPCGKWLAITSANQSQDVGIFGNASSGLGEKSRVEFSDFEVTAVSATTAAPTGSQH